MKLFIPEIGTKLKLASDWTFRLFKESRNYDIWAALDLSNSPDYRTDLMRQAALDAELQELEGLDRSTMTREQHDRIAELRQIRRQQSYLSAEICLPAETVLTVDRIYIRKGSSDYSSLSFHIHSTPRPELTPIRQGGTYDRSRRRFWAKLEDVNRVEFQPV